MKTEIFVKSNDKIFIIDNSCEYNLDIYNKSKQLPSYLITADDAASIEKYDILYIRCKHNHIRSISLFKKCADKKDAENIIKNIYQKLKEKSELLKQVQALKKCKPKPRETIAELKRKLKEEYFEIVLE